MVMGKRVLVIGAGIAGLSTASYLQRNGFQTEIFELHDLPGGLCTAWKRNGYTFDACIHWLMGSGPSSNLHEIWKELGAADLHYVEWDIHAVVRLANGDDFTMYTDPDRLEAEMLRLGPQDGRIIRRITNWMRMAMRLDLPVAIDKVSAAKRLALLARLPASLPLFLALKKPLSLALSGIKSARLREAFEIFYGGYLKDFPVGGMCMMLAHMAKKSAGYPIGGSLAFARAIERKYLSLGGKIHYGCMVDEILVENGRAVGVRGQFKGEASAEVRGDYVISAADAHDTVKRLLGGRFRNAALEAAFSSADVPEAPGLKRFPSLLYIGLGLARDFSSFPHAQMFKLHEPLKLENGKLQVDRLGLRLYSFDPTFAPVGKTAAIVLIETTNDSYWTMLERRDKTAYNAEKKAAAGAVVAALDCFVPGLKESVETVDVATPATFIRYTNNWHGSYEGWLPSAASLMSSLPKTLDGLEGFYMVGQWVSPGGGLPPCGFEARKLARTLCKKEGQAFNPD
jgi:phytoene dehydrogenase-like protein